MMLDLGLMVVSGLIGDRLMWSKSAEGSANPLSIRLLGAVYYALPIIVILQITGVLP